MPTPARYFTHELDPVEADRYGRRWTVQDSTTDYWDKRGRRYATEAEAAEAAEEFQTLEDFDQ